MLLNALKMCDLKMCYIKIYYLKICHLKMWYLTMVLFKDVYLSSHIKMCVVESLLGVHAFVVSLI